MKKIGLILLSMVMLFSFTACGDKKEDTTETKQEAEIVAVDSLEILTKVFDSYGEDEKFAITGGDYNNPVMDGPGAFDVSDAEMMDALLVVPADATSFVDEGASVMHMMNANTFTAGAFHIADSTNQQAFCDKVKDYVMNRQWMCGFPDTLIVVTIGDSYVVSAFGNAEIIENFKNKLVTVYPMAEVLYEENLAQ